MTEKRFIYKIKNGAMVIIDKKDNVLIRDKYRACDYLNQLNNENEQLKYEIEKLSYANEDLLKEKRIWKQMSDEYAKLYGENEQLKEEIKDLNDVLARYEEKELKEND